VTDLERLELALAAFDANPTFGTALAVAEQGATIRALAAREAQPDPRVEAQGHSTETVIDTVGAPVTFRHHDHEIDEPCAPPPAGIDVERLRALQEWLIRPDRAYSPHEIATYAYDEIAAWFAARPTPATSDNSLGRALDAARAALARPTPATSEPAAGIDTERLATAWREVVGGPEFMRDEYVRATERMLARYALLAPQPTADPEP
jgi:hypothetical protein